MKKSAMIALAGLVVCLFFVGDAGAQTRRAVVKFTHQMLFQTYSDCGMVHGVKDVPFKHTGEFLAYSIVWYSKDWDELTDRIQMNFMDILPGHTFEEDGHFEINGNKHVSTLYFVKNPAPKFTLGFYTKTQHVVDSLEIHFFDPGPTVKLESQNPKPSISQFPNFPISNPSACTCPQPPFQGRFDWCPDGSCPTDPTPDFVADPTHVIIHHTAGTNVASDWAAVVRSIWDFHVNVNLWDDIGYNWLVDPNGVLYEGRGDGRLGAHFCGQNGKTTGICVMGDFTSIQPQAAALNTLADFLAWETCDENIDPLGTSFHSGSGLTLMNVSGHRDGCQTSCPGDMFYPLLPSVRQATQDNIDSGCDVTALAAPTVLAITSVSHNKISLKWLDNSTTETGFAIERSDNVDNDFSPIIQLPANATAFSDNGVSPNNTYFYRLRAKQGSTFSDYSNVAVAITSVSSTAAPLHGGLLAVSPNPTSGQVSLSIENQWIGKTEVSVFDGLGRMVVPVFYEVKQNEKQVLPLDLGHLPTGLYWVKVAQGGEANWVKVVKD